jgi:hypothetical protein
MSFPEGQRAGTIEVKAEQWPCIDAGSGTNGTDAWVCDQISNAEPSVHRPLF